MRHRRIVLLLALATCVLVATAGLVTADATETKPEWAVMTGGEEQVLKAGEYEGLSEAVTTKVNWVLKQDAGAGITVECNGLTFAAGFAEGQITGPRGFRSGPLLFEGCKATAPANDVKCEVDSTGYPSGEIRTQAYGFEAEEALEGSTNTPHLRMAPISTREEIVTIQLKGTECANAGGYEVAGTLVAKIDTSALKRGHNWEFGKNTGTRLTIGGVEATFAGTGEVTLKSGNEWGDV